MSDLDIYGREDGSNERLDCIEDQGRAEDKAIWSVWIGRDFLLEHRPQSADQPQTWKGRYKNEGYMRSGGKIAAIELPILRFVKSFRVVVPAYSMRMSRMRPNATEAL